MLESVSTDSRYYPQERGARFAEGGGRFTAMPYDAAPSLSHLEASRALLGLAAAYDPEVAAMRRENITPARIREAIVFLEEVATAMEKMNAQAA